MCTNTFPIKLSLGSIGSISRRERIIEEVYDYGNVALTKVCQRINISNKFKKVMARDIIICKG
jgi:hypothetical protein